MKSDMVAEINGHTLGCPNDGCRTELHQRIGYSSDLIFGGRAYVGISSFAQADDGFQVGRVIAVDLRNGHKLPELEFHFQAVGTATSPPGTVHGGGVWNSLAADTNGVYFTTGNTRNLRIQTTEPSPNYGLSMIRIDKDTGRVAWAFRPVPFKLDDDPDWAAGATVMSTSCGELIALVQKDGWSYAVDANAVDPTGTCM
jgi:glucose dehydrogenase